MSPGRAPRQNHTCGLATTHQAPPALCSFSQVPATAVVVCRDSCSSRMPHTAERDASGPSSTFFYGSSSRHQACTDAIPFYCTASPIHQISIEGPNLEAFSDPCLCRAGASVQQPDHRQMESVRRRIAAARLCPPGRPDGSQDNSLVASAPLLLFSSVQVLAGAH